MLKQARRLTGEHSFAGSRKRVHQDVASYMTVTCCQQEVLPSS